jgi:ribosomal-protein-alanine N-acetyltransferase
MWTAPGFAQSSGFDRPRDLASVAAAVEGFIELNRTGHYFKWVIRSKASQEFFGECELYLLNPQGQPNLEWVLGYGLRPDAWGQGYMCEALTTVLAFAFQEYVVVRIKADLLPGNHRSQKVLQTLGFVYEGLQASKQFMNGQFHAMVLMAHWRERYHRMMTLDFVSSQS